jgi:preprotein translocase subunit SecE
MKPVTKREARKETRAILVFLVVLAVLFIVAFAGWYNGSWGPPP